MGSPVPPNFPSVARVRQKLDHQPTVVDPPHAVREAILQSQITRRVPAGGRIALTVGSRGIQGIAEIARSAVSTLKELGFEPFIVAAMGSHGGGTADGQKALLAELGVTETTAGCPISSSMNTVTLGTNRFGLPIHLDRAAHAADGILLLNRIKPHTSFTGSYESGRLKMLVVGLGKREGAAQVHKLGLSGLKTLLPEVGAFLLEHTKVVLGLALLENARETIARVVPIEPPDLLTTEPLLLDEARLLMGRLPFDQIDTLVVGELGKNYSGTGLDPNVIGRQRVETMPDLTRPKITRLAVLDLSPETRGNALGIGLADLTTSRLVAEIDPSPMRMNSLTSNFLTRARVPLSLPTDQQVLAACLDTCWRLTWPEARLVLIPNTLELETLWVSEALLADVQENTTLVQETDLQPIPFRPDGRIHQVQLFPHSTQGKRKPHHA